MKLPDLPKQNKHKEADFGVRFVKWVDRNYERLLSGSFELKDSHGKDYINFSEITPDQYDSGLANKSYRGKLYRIIQGGIGAADYHFYRLATAMVVIKYPREAFMIDVETLIMERERSKRKSLTSLRASEIATIKL